MSGNKHFVTRSIIEVVTLDFLWVTYKEAFVRFRIKLVGYQSPHKSFAAPNLEKRQVRDPPRPHLAWSLVYIFGKYSIQGKIVVSRAYPQKDKGSSVRLIIDCIISNTLQFLRSDTPFHGVVPCGISYEMIPHRFR
jgi:hypothetical protein